MDRRPQLEPDRALALDEPIVDIDRVLLMREKNALFQGETVRFITPDRQAELQAERFQVLGPVQVQRRGAGAFLAAETKRGTVGKTKKLGEMVEHVLPAQRRRQSGDQQAVIPARRHAGKGSGGVSAQAVGHEPFAVQQWFGAVGVGFAPRVSAGSGRT